MRYHHNTKGDVLHRPPVVLRHVYFKVKFPSMQQRRKVANNLKRDFFSSAMTYLS